MNVAQLCRFFYYKFMHRLRLTLRLSFHFQGFRRWAKQIEIAWFPTLWYALGWRLANKTLRVSVCVCYQYAHSIQWFYYHKRLLHPYSWQSSDAYFPTMFRLGTELRFHFSFPYSRCSAACRLLCFSNFQRFSCSPETPPIRWADSFFVRSLTERWRRCISWKNLHGGAR